MIKVLCLSINLVQSWDILKLLAAEIRVILEFSDIFLLFLKFLFIFLHIAKDLRES